MTVDDGSGPVSRAITTSFSQGAWIHYTVNVAPGGSVSIVAARTAGANAVISGVFLGPAGPPASGGPSPTPTPTPTPAPTPRTHPGTDANTHAGRDTHADTGADTNTHAGRDTTADTDAHAGRDAHADSYFDPNTHSGTYAVTHAGRDAHTNAQPDANADHRSARRAGRLGRRVRLARAPARCLEQFVGSGLPGGRSADGGPGLPSSMVCEHDASACARE